MKDFQINKIWANTIADISESIDSTIEYLKRELKSEIDVDTSEMTDVEKHWRTERIEEVQEKIKADEWALNLINAPFKISKK